MTTGLGKGAIRRIKYGIPDIPFGTKKMEKFRQLYTRKRRRFVPGRDRTGGFYGRYRGLDSELKFLDTEISTTLDATGEALVNLNVVPQGDTQSSRQGRKIVIKSIHIKVLS